jgi:twitching motility protein PilI
LVSAESGGQAASGASGEQLLEALRDLEARCRQNAAGLPQQEVAPDIWAGVLFRIGEHSLLVPLEEIGEVLEVPRDVTPVPATKDWVFGIANNRGTLLPIFDLRGFLFGSPTSRSARNRVLLIRRDEVPAGLLVAEVTGIRHFEARSQAAQVPVPTEALKPFVVGGFELGESPCPVLSLRRLTLDGGFNLAAA